MKIVTFFSTLMRYARAEAEAEKSGDPIQIAKAKADHEAYRQLCLRADEMCIPSTNTKR